MSWPPEYLTMDQATKIHGNIIFKTGEIITSTGENIMGVFDGTYEPQKNAIQDKELSTEDNKVITAEDNKKILV